MATIINTPPSGNTSSDSGLGLVLGIIVAIVLIVLFFAYALPAIRNSQTNNTQPQPGGANINVTLPSSGGNSGGTSGNSPSY